MYYEFELSNDELEIADDIVNRIVDLDIISTMELPSKETLEAKELNWKNHLQKKAEAYETEFLKQHEALNDAIEKEKQKLLCEKQKHENKIIELKKEIAEYESELSNLGLFSFSKKKTCKINIMHTESLISDQQQEIDDLFGYDFEEKFNAHYCEEVRNLSRTLAAQRRVLASPTQEYNVQKYIHTNWPTNTQVTFYSRCLIEMKCCILITLEEFGGLTSYFTVYNMLRHIKKSTITNFQSSPNSTFDEPERLNPQLVQQCLRQLRDDSIIEKIVINNLAHYKLK